MEKTFVKTVAKRYGYKVGHKVAQSRVRQRRKELGSAELRALKKELKEYYEKLLNPIYNHELVIEKIKGLKRQIVELETFINDSTKDERTRVKRFNEIVKELDEEIVNQLKDMGEYIEITTLPEEVIDIKALPTPTPVEA
jgi:DNA repair exonuclease SbcCD ATPase subunit